MMMLMFKVDNCCHLFCFFNVTNMIVVLKWPNELFGWMQCLIALIRLYSRLSVNNGQWRPKIAKNDKNILSHQVFTFFCFGWEEIYIIPFSGSILGSISNDINSVVKDLRHHAWYWIYVWTINDNLGKYSISQISQPKLKWQKATGYFHHIVAFPFPFCFTLRELCIGLGEVLPHTSRRICDWELLLSSHIFSKAPKFRG